MSPISKDVKSGSTAMKEEAARATRRTLLFSLFPLILTTFLLLVTGVLFMQARVQQEFALSAMEDLRQREFALEPAAQVEMQEFLPLRDYVEVRLEVAAERRGVEGVRSAVRELIQEAEALQDRGYEVNALQINSELVRLGREAQDSLLREGIRGTIADIEAAPDTPTEPAAEPDTP